MAQLGLTSARLLRRVRACERCVKRSCGAWERVWCVISGTATLDGAWGRVQSSMAARLPRVCRLAQDDLNGTFKNVIGAIFAAVMQRAVVCAV